jgi:hypothetical protein
MTLPQLHPEVVTLQNDCRLLTDELARLLTRKDNLLAAVIPNVQAEYRIRLGLLELEAFTLRVEVGRLKRIISLAQAEKNRGGAPGWEKIDIRLAAEFANWEAEMKKKTDEIDRAALRMDSLFSEEESHKLREFYYKLVKRLHPDVNPDMTEEEKRLWDNVSQAYRSGDLVELEALWLILQDGGPQIKRPDSLEILRSEKERLMGLVKTIMANIQEIKSKPPYTLWAKINDPRWIEKKQSEINGEIVRLEEAKGDLQKHVDSLMAESVDLCRWTIH